MKAKFVLFLFLQLYLAFCCGCAKVDMRRKDLVHPMAACKGCLKMKNIIWVRCDSAWDFDIYQFGEGFTILRSKSGDDKHVKIIDVGPKDSAVLFKLVDVVSGAVNQSPPFSPPGPAVTMLIFDRKGKVRKVHRIASRQLIVNFDISIDGINILFDSFDESKFTARQLRGLVPSDWFKL